MVGLVRIGPDQVEAPLHVNPAEAQVMLIGDRLAVLPEFVHASEVAISDVKFEVVDDRRHQWQLFDRTNRTTDCDGVVQVEGRVIPPLWSLTRRIPLLTHSGITSLTTSHSYKCGISELLRTGKIIAYIISAVNNLA